MIRLLHVVVQPVLVVDEDGELRPGPQTEPRVMTLSELDCLADRIRDELAALQRAAEAPA